MTTGSVFNNLMGQTVPADPEVGMGATVLMWTDRHAATIIEVGRTKAGAVKSVTVQEDKATRTDEYGMSDAQSYSYEPDPNGAVRVYTKRKNGAFVREGSPMNSGERVGIGYRKHYYDYSF